MIISKRKIKKSKKTDASRGIIVFRQNPIKRTILFDSDFFDDEVVKARFFLSFPYIFFAITYIIRKKKKKVRNKEKFVTTYRPTKLNICFSTDSELNNPFKAALPNIYGDNAVCIELPYEDFASEEDLAKKVVDTYWNSAFDPSELESYYQGLRKPLSNYKSWQKRTKNKPDWIPAKKDMIPIEELNEVFEIKEL